jgi:hypothetical protein
MTKEIEAAEDLSNAACRRIVCVTW